MSPDSRLAESVRISLFIELLSGVGEARLCALGSSMSPAVLPGDTLRVQRCAFNEACVGDIVMFTRDGRLFAHRVVCREIGTLVTQGDNLESPDAPVLDSEFLGRVVRVERPSIVNRIVRRGQQLKRRLVAA